MPHLQGDVLLGVVKYSAWAFNLKMLWKAGNPALALLWEVVKSRKLEYDGENPSTFTRRTFPCLCSEILS